MQVMPLSEAWRIPGSPLDILSNELKRGKADLTQRGRDALSDGSKFLRSAARDSSIPSQNACEKVWEHCTDEQWSGVSVW